MTPQQAGRLGGLANPHRPKFDRSRLRELYGSGLSLRETAIVAGCSSETVRRACPDLIELRAIESDALAAERRGDAVDVWSGSWR